MDYENINKPIFCSGKITILLILANVIFLATLHSKEYLNVASSRQAYLIKPIFEEFKKDTGIEVKYKVAHSKELIEDIKLKKDFFDIFLATDASDLYEASQKGILQPVRSKILNRNIPKHLKDPSNSWYGLSLRVRSLVYHIDGVDVSSINSYKDLGKKEFKGNLLLRTSQKSYNKSMVAMMIAEYGYEKTKIIINSWVKNLASKPKISDNMVLESILNGEGDLGIVNSYYLAKYLKDLRSLPLKMKFIGSKEGVHVNISGAGIVRYSKKKKSALKLLEWLSSNKAQTLFANLNLEYPVNKKVKPHKILQKWGEFKQNSINVRKAGELKRRAVKLMKEVGYE